jgi:hypothetical protein
LPFQSFAVIELVVIKVRSIILSGVSLLTIFANEQNYVNGLLVIAQTSKSKFKLPPTGFQEE